MSWDYSYYLCIVSKFPGYKEGRLKKTYKFLLTLKKVVPWNYLCMLWTCVSFVEIMDVKDTSVWSCWWCLLHNFQGEKIFLTSGLLINAMSSYSDVN